MINPYIGILILLVVTAFTLIAMLLMASYLGPRHKTKTKQIPFECGSVSVGDANSSRFSVRFYLVAMLFILFDIEVIFLYPWATNITSLDFIIFHPFVSQD